MLHNGVRDVVTRVQLKEQHRLVSKGNIYVTDVIRLPVYQLTCCMHIIAFVIATTNA